MTARRGRKPADGEPYIPLDTPGVALALGCPVTHPGALDRARLLLSYQRASACLEEAGRSLSRAIQTERRAQTRKRQARRELIQCGGDPGEADALLKRLGLYRPPQTKVKVKEEKQRVTGLLRDRTVTERVIPPTTCSTCDGKTFYPGMSWTCPTCGSHYNCPS